MKKYIVLINVKGNYNARKNANDIEDGNYLDKGALADEIEGDFEVMELTDFMELVNNDEFYEELYFISYVNLQN